MDTAHGLVGWKLRIRFIIELSAGNDVRVDPAAGQMESEVAEKLAGRGMIGEEKTIEKDDAVHLSAVRGAKRLTAGAPGQSLSHIVIIAHAKPRTEPQSRMGRVQRTSTYLQFFARAPGSHFAFQSITPLHPVPRICNLHLQVGAYRVPIKKRASAVGVSD